MRNSPYEILKETKALIQKDLSLDITEQQYSEEELLDLLADYVLFYIEKNLEQLFSLLYRLDIDEQKVHFALSPNATAPANLVIAQLILDREKEKAKTRIRYRMEDGEDEDVSPW